MYGVFSKSVVTFQGLCILCVIIGLEIIPMLSRASDEFQEARSPDADLSRGDDEARGIDALKTFASKYDVGEIGRNGIQNWLDHTDELLCDESVVLKANSVYLRNLLRELVNTTYFRLFRVQLDGDCNLKKPQTPAVVDNVKPDEIAKPQDGNGHCSSGYGGLESSLNSNECKCTSSSAWWNFFFGFSGVGDCPHHCRTDLSKVDVHLSSREGSIIQQTKYASQCEEDNSPGFWLNLCSELPFPTDENYVNLQLNPETYTGYNGSKIWKAIYAGNCFELPDNATCYEERFLYQMLSGIHSSINLHISEKFFAPGTKRSAAAAKGTDSINSWGSNLDRFKKHFVGFNERYKNLQFAFLVLLRAIRKASPVLEKLDYSTDDAKEAGRTHTLLRLLLNSHALSSCQEVFEAFDESQLFENIPHRYQSSTSLNLKRKFKSVFHNISNSFNCISCQKCRLHGKMQLLGVGTAIKILLLPEDFIASSLTRGEVVALINTADKISHALEIHSKFSKMIEEEDRPSQSTFSPDEGPDLAKVNKSMSTKEIQRLGLSLIADGVRDGELSMEEEDWLVDAVINLDWDIVLLVEFFLEHGKRDSFLRHALRRYNQLKMPPRIKPEIPDVIVMGAGLSGLSASLSILDRGGSVVLIDKEMVAGGNSAKASSGVNGIDESSESRGDSVELFRSDVLTGAGVSENPLVDVLTAGSVDALKWLRSRVNLPLNDVGQLGGHSAPRTWRPTTGLAGAEIISSLNKAVKDASKDLSPEKFSFLKRAKVSRILQNDEGGFEGVECENVDDGSKMVVKGHRLIIASGGYAFHIEKGSLLSKIRPDLTRFATTNGHFATGDGIQIATAVGAGTVDLEEVQVHPTAFIDPKDRNARVKTLAAELLRGAGAIILTPEGRRFVNELGTRKYVSGEMMRYAAEHSESKTSSVETPEFIMLLNEKCAEQAPKHIATYTKKGLLSRYESMEDLSMRMGINSEILRETLTKYDKAVEGAVSDPYNRTVFNSGLMVDSNYYYAGLIQPAVHYSMGGLKIDPAGHVLNNDDVPNPLLGGRIYAVGEVVGGIHGKNRLGGNALTESTVFGCLVGRTIELESTTGRKSMVTNEVKDEDSIKTPPVEEDLEKLKEISPAELSEHSSPDDCWVSISDKVYDFSEFATHHPGGAESITNLCGQDGTEEFSGVHSMSMLEDFDAIGELAECEEKCTLNTGLDTLF